MDRNELINRQMHSHLALVSNVVAIHKKVYPELPVDADKPEFEQLMACTFSAAAMLNCMAQDEPELFEGLVDPRVINHVTLECYRIHQWLLGEVESSDEYDFMEWVEKYHSLSKEERSFYEVIGNHMLDIYLTESEEIH